MFKKRATPITSGPSPEAQKPNRLQDVLLSFPTQQKVPDQWTAGDACEGTQIFGATGSGKTSGSGQAIAKAFLQSGYGGLVLCAKVDERQLWERYAAEAGRSDDICVFSPTNDYRFNFLDYEMKRSGAGAGLTENIAQLFMKALELAGNSASGSNADPFWNRAMLQMLRNAIDTIAPSGETLGLNELYQAITTAPRSRDDFSDNKWLDSSFLFRCLRQGRARIENGLHPERKRDFELAANYWFNEFAVMPSRTRSSVISVFTSMADGFLRGPMFDLFCTDTTVKPEWTHEGAIIILDLPVKEYGEVGIVAQGIFKYLWQQATERRRVTEQTAPVFLWADESQFFTNSYDMLFQTTARSARAATVYLTQNISNYYTVMRGETGHSTVDSLMGNFQTKIFHTNGDAVTNQWASDQIGPYFKAMASMSNPTDGSSNAVSTSVALMPRVLASEFLKLKNGGTRNALLVEALLMKPGRRFIETNNAHRPVSFEQG